MNNENQITHKFDFNPNWYGWNDKLSQLKQGSLCSTLPYGCIFIARRTYYEAAPENRLFQCELTGNMMHGKSDIELFYTSDQVLLQPFDENKGVIVYILPRERTLYRKKNGTVADKQAIASYVDKAFTVQSLDDNFDVRRVGRSMAQVLKENTKPILVLNKSNLDFGRQSAEEQTNHISNQISVLFTNIHQPQAILQLRESMSEGETVVFVGSPGVGKSSLVNALCEKMVLLTPNIGSSTGKGRHISTRREIVLTNDSGVLINTPGVCKFGLVIDSPDLLIEVLEISNRIGSCHFKDCKHINKPGRAALEAVSSSVLDYKVYASYLKFRRGAWHFLASEHEKHKKEKSSTRLVEEVEDRKASR